MPKSGHRTLSWLLLISILTATLVVYLPPAAKPAAAKSLDDLIIDVWTPPIELAY